VVLPAEQLQGSRQLPLSKFIPNPAVVRRGVRVLVAVLDAVVVDVVDLQRFSGSANHALTTEQLANLVQHPTLALAPLSQEPVPITSINLALS